MAAYAITYLSSLPVAVGVRKRAKQKKKKKNWGGRKGKKKRRGRKKECKEGMRGKRGEIWEGRHVGAARLRSACPGRLALIPLREGEMCVWGGGIPQKLQPSIRHKQDHDS